MYDVYRTSPYPIWACGILSFVFSFIMRNQLDIAIASAFVGTYSSILFPFPIILALTPYIAFTMLYFDLNVVYINYFMSLYMFCTILEWHVHRYIMHAPMFFPPLQGYLKTTCERHQFHHGVTKDDMTLEKIESPFEIILSWNTVGMVFATLLSFSYLTVNTLIPFTFQLAVSATTALVWGYAWNTLHADLHDHNNLKYKLTDGPGLLKVKFPIFLYENHVLHHRIKGKDKGNFNIVFLGGDHILGTNWTKDL